MNYQLGDLKITIDYMGQTLVTSVKKSVGEPEVIRAIEIMTEKMIRTIDQLRRGQKPDGDVIPCYGEKDLKETTDKVSDYNSGDFE